MSAAPAFRIEIIPELPDGPSRTSGRDYGALRGEVLARTNEWRQLVYRVGAEMYAHYPADIVTVLADLEAEAAAFAEGRSHDVELAGRTVCHARCGEGRAWFVEARGGYGPQDDPPIKGEGVTLAELRAAFDEAAARVRGYLDQLLAEPPE